eukprot:5944352-Amphidinium_carterae.1
MAPRATATVSQFKQIESSQGCQGCSTDAPNARSGCALLCLLLSGVEDMDSEVFNTTHHNSWSNQICGKSKI